jgi:hypothetical protein
MTRLLLLAVAFILFAPSATPTHAQVRQNTPNLPHGISESWWQQVQASLRQREYYLSKCEDGRYTSPNRAQNLRFVYEPNGFSATRRDSLAHLWQARLTYNGISKHGATPQIRDANNFTLTANANTLTAQSNAVVINYRNDEKGMRQDFIVNHKPNGEGDLHLWLNAEMQGGTVSATAEQISFLTASGTEAMRYSDLKVWDARHKPLKAYFEQKETYLAIVVSDKDAQYPITIDPLSATPNWTAESNQGSSVFGWSVASAGDVNGDGFSDVIVGAYGYDNGEIDEGSAFVYYGSSSGLNLTPDWTGESNQAGAEFGISVASAGDVNGDGYDDVIVGSGQYDNSETNEGAAFLYYGSFSGLNTTPVWITYGGVANGLYGFFVASAGDVNGDGFSDVLVGSPTYLNQGAAFAYYGSFSGLDTTASWLTLGGVTDALYGRSVASAGDVNGDGFSDIVIGSNGYTNTFTGEGAAFVYHGSPIGLSGLANWVVYGNQDNARYGVSVASAGDVNGDGFSDVIIGAWAFDNGQTDEGAAFVYHGSASGLSPTANWTVESNQAGARLGLSVASAGDVNGDGFSDVIVGAYFFDNPEAEEGAAFVWLGSANGVNGGTNGTPTNAAWMAEGNQAGAQFGVSVASAGDVNGDGFSDVIVGAWLFDNGDTDEGTAYVYHGSGTSFVTQTVSADGLYTFPPTGVSISFSDVSGSGTCKVVRYDNPAINRSFIGISPLFTSRYRFIIKATGFTFSQAELRFNRTQIPNAGISDASTVNVYRRPLSSTGSFNLLSNSYTPSAPDEVRAITTAFSEFILGSNDANNQLPVELTEFGCRKVESGIQLHWKTATELNNSGFEVERKSENRGVSAEWQVLGFVRGRGTTTEAQSYSFLDKTASGKVQYRLKQIDFDGRFEYSNIIEVDAGLPKSFTLEQNYPNPFNPTTLISYQLPVASDVKLDIYDVLGRNVMSLVNGRQEAGSYTFTLNASNLATGIYFYRLQAGNFVSTKKMMLVK